MRVTQFCSKWNSFDPTLTFVNISQNSLILSSDVKMWLAGFGEGRQPFHVDITSSHHSYTNSVLSCPGLLNTPWHTCTHFLYFFFYSTLWEHTAVAHLSVTVTKTTTTIFITMITIIIIIIIIITKAMLAYPLLFHSLHLCEQLMKKKTHCVNRQ